MYTAGRRDSALLSSCFRETLSVDCGPRHRIRVITDWAPGSSTSSSSQASGHGSDEYLSTGEFAATRSVCYQTASWLRFEPGPLCA